MHTDPRAEAVLTPVAAAAPVLVVMGVSAAGKTTVMTRLADRLGLPARDADELHPRENRAKMAGGTPLTDDDRWPWLDAVGEVLRGGGGGRGMIVACSALRRVYRDRLRATCPDIAFLHLSGSREVLAARAAARADHFMPPSLLDSQLATLEPLEPDEPGTVIDVDAPVDEVVRRAAGWVVAHAT